MIKKIVTTRFVDEESRQEYQFEPVEDTISFSSIEKGGKGERGYVLKYLTLDQNPMSPDEFGDDCLFLVHYHRQFCIPNKEISEQQLAEIYHKKEEETNDYYVFPVSAYIHSGVILSLGNHFGIDPGGWDTSHVGAIFASKKEWDNREKALSAAECLLKEWNHYLSGEVYCCVREKLDEEKVMDDYDIVGGFYGYEDAKEALKNDDF